MIAGYAAVFNSPSADMGFIETIDPLAFSKTILEADVRALGNHDVDWLLGRTKPGSLRLSTDQTGLRYEIDVNQADPDGVRAVEKVRRGDMDGASFSFQTIRDEWNWEAAPPQRRLLEVALIDVGPVVYPAYEAATAQARAILQGATSRRTPRLALAEAELGLLRLRVPDAAAQPRQSPDTRPSAALGGLARRVQIVRLEARAGKVLSGANAQKLLDIIEQIEQILIDAGAVEAPEAA